MTGFGRSGTRGHRFPRQRCGRFFGGITPLCPSRSQGLRRAKTAQASRTVIGSSRSSRMRLACRRSLWAVTRRSGSGWIAAISVNHRSKSPRRAAVVTLGSTGKRGAGKASSVGCGQLLPASATIGMGLVASSAKTISLTSTGLSLSGVEGECPVARMRHCVNDNEPPRPRTSSQAFANAKFELHDHVREMPWPRRVGRRQSRGAQEAVYHSRLSMRTLQTSVVRSQFAERIVAT